MKTKTFKTGTLTCKTYLKSAGQGYEVGFTQGRKTLFLGHFVKSTEANFWYNFMNREIRKFGKKYKVGETYPATWLLNFISNHLMKRYCTYQTKILNKHNREAARKERIGQRRYKQLNRRWEPSEKKPVFRAA